MNPDAQPRGRVVVVLSAFAVAATLYNWATDFFPPSEYSPGGPPPYTISKETTYITEPLRPDGSVDYVAALNTRLREGVTPENNAAVLLMEVMGSGAVETEIREAFFQHLGVPVPEDTKGVLQQYWDFLDAHLEGEDDFPRPPKEPLEEWDLEFWRDKSTGAKRKAWREALLEKSWETQGKPWTRDEYPLVARWLTENQDAIDLIVTAARRPHLYVPLVPEPKDQGLLTAFPYEVHSGFREFARVLSTRAMLSIGEDRIEAAQRDLLALHYLAGHLGNGSSTINFLTASAFDAMACEGDQILAQSEFATPVQLAEYRARLSSLPPVATMSEILAAAERYYLLDIIPTIVTDAQKYSAKARNQAVLFDYLFNCPEERNWRRYRRLELDWDVVLGIVNERYDQLVAALKLPSYKQRVEAIRKIEADLLRLRKESLDPIQVSLLLRGKKSPRDVISREFANEFVLELVLSKTFESEQTLPELQAEVEVRTALRREMTIIALALAEYQKLHGSYPGELAELSPKYLTTIPQDGFTGESLKYRRQKDGYVLYSVGPNGKDDGGKRNGQDADDVAIRVPREMGD